DSIVLFTQRGAVKRMSLSEFEKTSRAKRGVVMLRELKKNPHRVAALFACGLHQRFMAETEKGDRKELLAKDFRTNDRYSNGSFFIDEEESGKVTAVWRLHTEQ
ncbi:DNA gyrase subunit A, partial [Bacillus inaquosorum]